MKLFKRGEVVELDGLLGVVVGTPEDDGVCEDHLKLWFGKPQGKRISEGGSGGLRPEVWIVPAEYCELAQPADVRH